MWQVFLPIRAVQWVGEAFGAIKTLIGCPKSKVRFHRYEWGFGPEAEIQPDGLVTNMGGGWWLYCDNCGKRLE
jgi:hypothetical protein